MKPCAIKCRAIWRSAVLAPSVVALFAILGAFALQSADEQQPFGLEQRVPWTTSRVVGSPDPPLPYTVEKIFTNIQWRAPIFVTAEPDSDSLLVIQHNQSL